MDTLILDEVVKVQPLKRRKKSTIFHLHYMYYRTYFATEVAKGIWRTCSYQDIATPGYEPYFIITTTNEVGFAVYNSEGKPIVCTNREIFKHTKEFDIDHATWVDKEKVFYENPTPRNPLNIKPGIIFDHNGEVVGKAKK